MKFVTLLFSVVLLGYACKSTKQHKTNPNYNNMMVRIAEIEIDAAFRDEYLAVLKEEVEASVRLEPGVICIYPMFQKKNPTQIKLLEIYANKEAYESHLQTPHFKHYKTTTLKMVKSLNLMEMEAIDPGAMRQIFKKLGQ